MREIKFRAWDKKRGVMESSVGFTDSDCGRVWQREAYMIDDRSNFASSDWIPMQYTGLKDKNGKEIYEGDVVKCDEPMGIGRLFKSVKGEIIYLGNVASFAVNIQTGENEIGDLTAYSWEIGHFRNFEIIGTIHENPELLSLEEKK